ncbi:hypothetical protein [Chryseobacterium sp. IT-36CA2]|uniref:hypothetical protein n=1 Tax=Chryseobacterium sp. IT-36CA2 TaxID=3026460 RepID=UPI0039DFE481
MKTVVKAFYGYYDEFPYDILEVKFIFTLGGSYDVFISYHDNDDKKYTSLDGRELFKYEHQVYELFKTKIDTEEKFNVAIYKIKKDGTYSSLYEWESEKANENLIDYANVFPHWANDRMMSMIFEFEKDNGLIPTQYDNDGGLEYLSSWDSGIFTFHINDKNELKYKIVLTKDGVERVLEMPLKDYFIKGILKHYHSTNTELSNIWEPWNTMVLKSPHNDIPSDKKDEFVSYILE